MFSKRTNSLEIERIFALPESRRQRSLALQTAAILAFYQPFLIGHVLNERGTGYEHIFSWYEHSISIELKMGHVI